jgi:HTH-type transcriptional regulator/antitoxin MqsA
MARNCINCKSRKGMTHFENETFTIDHAGMSAKVKRLSGWRCDSCGEVEFDADSAQRYAAAGDELVLRERTRQSKDIRRIRLKLGLKQVEAARLTGGGHNAFSRYERGEAMPMPAVINLFRLLDKHPKLLKELLGPKRGPDRARSSGDDIILERKGDVFCLTTQQQRIQRAQKRAKKFLAPGTSMADELIAERRETAKDD